MVRPSDSVAALVATLKSPSRWQAVTFRPLLRQIRSPSILRTAEPRGPPNGRPVESFNPLSGLGCQEIIARECSVRHIDHSKRDHGISTIGLSDMLTDLMSVGELEQFADAFEHCEREVAQSIILDKRG